MRKNMQYWRIHKSDRALHGQMDLKWRPIEAYCSTEPPATTLSQCITGAAVWPCRCSRQPMLAVATATGLPFISVSSFLFLRLCESEGCNKLQVPAERQHRRTS